jgi:glutamine synthetase
MFSSHGPAHAIAHRKDEIHLSGWRLPYPAQIVNLPGVKPKSQERILVIGSHSAAVSPSKPLQGRCQQGAALGFHALPRLLLAFRLRKNGRQLKIDDAKPPIGLAIRHIAHFRVVVTHPKRLQFREQLSRAGSVQMLDSSPMAKYKLEYLWLDGYEPVPTSAARLRSRNSSFPEARRTPDVGLRRQLDPPGRRSQLGLHAQARGRLSGQHPQERRARHVRSHDAGWQDTRIPSNSRATILDDPDAWFGFRAGILPLQGRRPSASRRVGFPSRRALLHRRRLQERVGDIAREIVEEHLDLCLDAGINHEGINAEVAKGQWEFQIFGKGSKNAADQMWVARYLLMRLCEKYGVDVNFHCKPLGKDVDWNGSGMHSNFSTKHMREVGGKEYFEALMAAFDKIQERAHRRVRPGQPHAPHRPA